MVRLGRRRIARLFRGLWPAIIAGASDNDPTTVGTLSVVGSTTGYALAWLLLLAAPLLLAVLLMSSSLGLVTRRGLESAIKEHYGPQWALLAMLLVLAVNMMTLAADLKAGAAALQLLSGLDWRYLVVPLAILEGSVLLLGTYRLLERYLVLLLFLFLSYLGAAIAAGPDWAAVLRSTFVPQVQLTREFFAGGLAILGTTLTSYVYFWQTIEEEERRPSLRYLPIERIAAVVGVAYAVVVFWSILVATGTTLYPLGRAVETAEDAAAALAPLVGPAAYLLFATGLLASALLAIPVLVATSAFVVSESFGWRAGWRIPGQRRQFRSLLAGILVLGALIAMVDVPPMRLLFVASIVGGLCSPVTLLFLVLLTRDPEVMQGAPVQPWLQALGWIAVATTSVAALGFVLWEGAVLVW